MIRKVVTRYIDPGKPVPHAIIDKRQGYVVLTRARLNLLVKGGIVAHYASPKL